MSSTGRKFSPATTGVLVMLFLFIICGVASALTSSRTYASRTAVDKDLPVVGTYEKLQELLKKTGSYSQRVGALENIRSGVDFGVAAPPVAMESSSIQKSVAADGVPGYSGTNIQVEGVDEADLVKCDGKYIYQVNKQEVLVIKAYPADSMQVVSRLKFEDPRFSPQELLLDEKNLIVIGNSNVEHPVPGVYRTQGQIYPPRSCFNITRALVYNIENKSKVTKVRELDLEGDYLTSRKVGSSFYLLANKNIDYYWIQRGEEDGITPRYRDSVKQPEFVPEKLEEIRYFPEYVQPNYLVIGTLDLDQPSAPADIQSYLGAGESVYASPVNLYVAVSKYGSNLPVPLEKRIAPGSSIYVPQENRTVIYRFALEKAKVNYTGEGSVPGTILNQFSMDENGDYFRIATTSGDMWRTDENTSRNNVYILDDGLQIVGWLENIAPGEKIYSTRFMGDRAYMVTFKQVDPFFVLDLKDPRQPAILGKLKIPGYSDYLHPYDENHIIGFGKDTVEVKGWNGSNQAFYQGMKVAIFDVTDVSNPVEMSRVVIGDRGTDSELLRDHKALLFSREKKLLAFPVTLMELNKNLVKNPSGSAMPEYGSFSFQGLYVYHVDLEKGLQFRGRISHLSSEDYSRAGDYWYDDDKNIGRALYIGDKLYSISRSAIKAHQLSNLQEVKNLRLR